MNEGLSTKDAKKLNKASVLSHSNNPEDQDRARARQVEVDYKDLMKQIKARKRIRKESFVLEREDSPYEKASSGALAGKTRSSGASKTEPKTGFGRKAHRNSAAMIIRAKRKAERSGKKLSADSAAELAHRGWASSVKHHQDSMTPEQRERRNKLAKTKYKDLSKDEQDKDKVSAKAIMSVHDKQKKKKTNSESFEIDTDAHNKAKKKAKLRNLARGNENPAEKAAAEKKAGGPKLYGEEDNFSQKDKELKRTKSARNQRYNTLHSGTNTSKNTDVNEGASIIQGGRSSKKVGYRGPTSGKSQPKKSASFRGEKDEKIPPKNKSARYGSQLHRLRPRSERVNEELTFEGWKDRAASAIKKVVKKKEKPHKYPEGGGPYVDAGAEAADRVKKKEQRKVGILPDQRGTARKDDR